MLFSKMSVDRAYIYFFNDSDEPQMHGSAGLTRNFKPKPAFHAVAHLYKTMGEYRFARVIQEKSDAYAYEFTHGSEAGKKIWAVWSPTGSSKKSELTLALENSKLVRAEQMPLAPGDAPVVTVKQEGGSIIVPVDESPVFIWLEASK